MHIVAPPDLIKEYTRLYEGERYPDGRPRVSDDILERMKPVTTEEAWGVLRRNGYNFQFEGGWFRTHPGRILVGRAVTTVFVPRRPDLHELVEEVGLGEGRIGGQNSWVIDTLETGDVMVVDLFVKIKDGTFVGDNLATSVRTRTKAGAVIDGGIRDYQGIMHMDDLAIFCRGVDPSAILDTTLLSINLPMCLGETTVMPGDVILGTPSGIMFIPAHLAQAVVERSEDIRVRDYFGKLRLTQKVYTPGEIDRKWSDEIQADFENWVEEQKKAGIDPLELASN